MVQYGDVETVKAMLRADEDISYGSDIDARLTAIGKAVTMLIDEKTGRAFGVAGTDTTALYWVGPYDTIVLTRPARSVTSITYGGTISGTTMTGGTTVLAADLVYPLVDRDGLIYAIRAATGGPWAWYDTSPYYQTATRTPVVVTATAADTGTDATVPDDITYIADYLTAEVFKREKASPAGFLGPEGVVPMRDVLKDPLVVTVFDKYRVRELVV